MFARLRALLRALASRRRFEADLTDELRFHIEEYTEALVRSGSSADDARRRARMELGGIDGVKADCRDARGLAFVDALEQDLRYSIRQLRRHTGFTMTVVVTLALAIGTNTAVFSIVNALLLESLPYPHPERLATLYARTSGPQASSSRRTIDGEQWERMRDEVPAVLCAVSGMQASGANFQAGSLLQYVHAGRVSAHYFDVLSIRPAVGRSFSDEEDRPQGPKVAILSYALWQRAFGGSASVLGQTVLLKREPHTVVGVLPQDATTPLNADIYTALQPSREGEGQAANFVAIMRLHEGAGWQQANDELQRAMSNTGRATRFAGANPGAELTYYSVPLQQASTAAVRPQILAAMLAAAGILLIACANIAGLTLVRMRRRAGEIAMRVALGASRWQVQRQVWAEHTLLALAGGTAATGVGVLALHALLRLLPDRSLPLVTASLDGRVVAFTLVLSLLTSTLAGVLPAVIATDGAMRSTGPGRGVIGGGRHGLRHALVAGQVALTVVIVAATGLLVRTLIGLEGIPPGFNPAGVITAKASLDDVRYRDPEAFRALLRDSLLSMRDLPGVQQAAVGLTLPYERALLHTVTVGSGPTTGQQVTTNEVYVSPRYFETLQMPVLAGRSFTDADGPDAQPVAIVNQTFARKFLQRENVIGLYLGGNRRIVGVVADTVLSSAARLNTGSAPLTREEIVYLPAAQVVDAKFLALIHVFLQPSWIVRTTAPHGMPDLMQRALAQVDPQLPVSGFYDMRDLMAETLATQRIQVALLTTLSSLALLLSAVGIFALVAHIVVQRTREIGIRMALGSTVRETMVRVGGTSVGAVASGLVAGLFLCAGALPMMRGVLYGVDAYDPPTLLTVVLTVATVTLLATTPILRIASIDPATTLRED